MCLWKCPESALQIPTVIYFFPNIGLKTSPWLSQSSWSHQKKEKGHDNNISIWLIFLFKCSFHHIHVFCHTRSKILRLILCLVWYGQAKVSQKCVPTGASLSWLSGHGQHHSLSQHQHVSSVSLASTMCL